MKIFELEELAQKIHTLQAKGKKIVLCHGCFDLMHPGHIKYFQAAKKMGDILVVTITPDIYVDKGPGRPVFKEDLRAECIAALEGVDYVAINKWPTAEKTLRLLRPDIYVKGQEFENLEDKTGKLQKEYEIIKELGAEIRFTQELVFSSTRLLNQYHPQITPIDTDKKPWMDENREFVSNNLRESVKSVDKILLLDDLIAKVENLKAQGKTIVQSHGVFDLIHPGVIAHLKDAKKQGDVLIVTVIRDRDVRKGPGRPIFQEKLRVENVASLEQVDYASLVDDDVPFDCVGKLRPDIFVKGKDYKERDRVIREKVHDDEKELYRKKCRIHETEGFSFSSSQIINNSLEIYPEDTKLFIKNFLGKYNFDYISQQINELKKLKVLIIGDGIIDEYHYCETMGKSPKSQLIVNKYIGHEVFPGGAFAIANHIAGLCDEVELVTVLGGNDSRADFVLDNLKSNIRAKLFYRDDGQTIVKKRYLNNYNKQKLFEVNFMNDSFVPSICESSIIDYLQSKLSEFDLILVSDFGHGLITDTIIRIIEKSARKIAVNTQTNGANAGYNLITKYSNVSFICLDDPEARLATQMKYADVRDVGLKLLHATRTEYLMITLGSEGSMCFSKTGNTNHTPALSSKVVDIIGAGDAFFSFAAPSFALGMPADLFSFIGNAAGALAVQIVGNKKPVEKYELLEFIHAILK